LEDFKIMNRHKDGLQSRKSLIWGSYYAMFVNGVLTLMLGAVMPYLIQAYGLGYEIGGLMLAAHSAGHLTASLLVSVMALKLGRKLSAALLSLAGALGFVGMIYTSLPVVLVSLYFLTGLARGSASTVTNEIVNEASLGDAHAMNILHTFYAVGAFIAPFLALICVQAGLGWQAALVITALGIAARSVLFLAMPIEEQGSGESGAKPAAEVGVSRTEAGTNSGGYLKNPAFYIIAGLLFFYLGAESAINGWAVTYLKDAGIMSTGFAQSILSLLWVVIIFGRLFAGRLSRSVGKARLLVIQAVGSSVFFFLFMLTRSVVPLALWIIGLGFFFAGVFPTAVAVIGPELKGAKMGMGLLIFIAGFGAILMPMVTGIIAEQIGIYGGMATIGASLLLMLLFSMIVDKRTKSR